MAPGISTLTYLLTYLSVVVDMVACTFVVGGVFCPRIWDSVSCWPTTSAGQTAVVSCPDQFGGVPIDTTRKQYASNVV